MKICLLYKDREWIKDERYPDAADIINDLGLKTIFSAGAKRIVYENDEVKAVETEDTYLAETLKAVMMVPLSSAEEIAYRQAMIKDSITHEEFIRGLYESCRDLIVKWVELGRGKQEKASQSNPAARLMTDIKTLELFRQTLSDMKMMIREQKDFSSGGLCSFRDDFLNTYTDELEDYFIRVLSDIEFYADRIDESDERNAQVITPRIVLECGLEDGLKFSSLKLEDISSQRSEFIRPGSIRHKLKNFADSWIPDSFSTTQDMKTGEQSGLLEYTIVSYLAGILWEQMWEYREFFDKLKFQTGFYLATIQLIRQMERFEVGWCFPGVCGRRDIGFEELKEFTLEITQRTKAIGNTCSIWHKDLLVVTGANQGGKSTFLRSIGIAQVMMQCGLPVAARSYESGIFPRIFVHFTRREDATMNSGRLDEELSRMSRIVDRIGDGSLILLNESFATTTEKEGSMIAYDIVKALTEAGVRVFTVTHLLSFAKRIYEETKDMPDSPAEFFSAERKEDGTRTFRMIRHEPELTSFGMELYEEIVEGKKAQ
ncbi:MAG: hypothetical protein K6G81_01330 [Lachnospiraceae bacterium]|nr:hypothetical protein [Lachnospiraceae bacterium]